MNLAVKVIIPAYNEEESIVSVVKEIPTIVDEIIVVNNNSTDRTGPNASQAGATVLKEPNKGYGYACLRGMDYIAGLDVDQQPDVIVFLDGDYSDYPEQLSELIAPIEKDDIDFVIGSRVKELRERGAMLPQQVFGNWLATILMKFLLGAEYTDLGPFRAIKYSKLLQLEMQDRTYGWTIEMQLKAIKHELSYKEIPVKYRNRIGVSKVSGTLKGSVSAGVKILTWIFKYSIK